MKTVQGMLMMAAIDAAYASGLKYQILGQSVKTQKKERPINEDKIKAAQEKRDRKNAKRAKQFHGTDNTA